MKKTIEEDLGTGRRKRAIAAVRLRPGTGKIRVNGREFDEYFPSQSHREMIVMPLQKMGMTERCDLLITCKGGGISAQADASRLGIARALLKGDETRRHDLKVEGFLRRDPRKKERKKYGLAGARKAFQFSKR